MTVKTQTHGNIGPNCPLQVTLQCNSALCAQLNVQSVMEQVSIRIPGADTRGVMATFKQHESTSVDTLPPSTKPAPKPPSLRLGQAGAFGVLLFIASGAIIAAAELPLGPFRLPLICSAWSALGIYGVSLIGMDLLILVIELITKRDINRDGTVGRPRRTGRTVINKQPQQWPENWQDLADQDQVADLKDFVWFVWKRDQAGLGIGQREFRKLDYHLPSGFKVTDKLHAVLFEYLRDAEIARKNGTAWEIQPKAHWEKRIDEIYTAGL